VRMHNTNTRLLDFTFSNSSRCRSSTSSTSGEMKTMMIVFLMI